MRGKAGLFSRFQPFDPKTISGLTAWWDSSDSATLYDAASGGSLVASGGAVARVEDKSGNGRHLTQSSSAERPSRTAAIKNGLDVIRFDGTNDWFTATSAMSAFISSTACSVFVVAKATAINTDSDSQLYNDAIFVDSATYNGFVALRSNNTASSYGWGQLFVGVRTASASYNAGDWKVFTTTHGSSTLSLRINGGTASTAELPFRQYMNNEARVGHGYDGIAFFDGDLGEILTYNVELSEANRQQVEAYLFGKWGI